MPVMSILFAFLHFVQFCLQVFPGNTNSHAANVFSLEVVIIARHIKIIPQSWYNHICLRIEFYGCEGRCAFYSYALLCIVAQSMCT